MACPATARCWCIALGCWPREPGWASVTDEGREGPVPVRTGSRLGEGKAPRHVRPCTRTTGKRLAGRLAAGRLRAAGDGFDVVQHVLALLDLLGVLHVLHGVV